MRCNIALPEAPRYWEWIILNSMITLVYFIYGRPGLIVCAVGSLQPSASMVCVLWRVVTDAQTVEVGAGVGVFMPLNSTPSMS
jgi:hypothetical protein